MLPAQARFGRVSDDAGLPTKAAALPASLLVEGAPRWRAPRAAVPDVTVDDRFAMAFGAVAGWAVGRVPWQRRQ